MKKLLVILLFLVLPFSIPTSIFAQSISTDSSPTTAQQLTWWQSFWNWLTSFFIQNNYEIKTRSFEELQSNMSDYGSTRASAGTRLTNLNNQNCFKGNVIKNVINGIAGYSDSNLSYICIDSSSQCSVSNDSSCELIKLSNIAHYFVQTNQKFYCDQTNKLIEIESDFINKVNQQFTESIPSNELACYKDIYDDLYLIPKDSSEDEENSQKIIRTPIPAKDQKQENTQQDLGQQFTYQGSSSGLNGLRPAGW